MRKLSPTTKYILQAMIPYTEVNFRLAFKPSSFFYELSKKEHINERTLYTAYYRAQKQNLIGVNENKQPYLTEKGIAEVKRLEPARLKKDVRLLIIFDIPEDERKKRDHLRALLRELSFTKVQQSVWESKYDYRDYLALEIKQYQLQDYVIVFEAAKLRVS